MNIGDLFKPKWKNSDPKIRLVSVKTLLDQKQLAWIASYDNVDIVRKAAITKIKDQKYFAFVAKHGLYEREQRIALQQLGDANQKIFLEIITKKKSSPVLIQIALAKIKQENLITDLAKNGHTSVVRIQAIQLIKAVHHQQLLSRICINDSDDAVQEEALEKLQDQNLLNEIAHKHSKSEIRKKAIRKLDLQHALFDILFSDNDQDIQKDALTKLKDQNFLGEIARKHTNSEIRIKVLANLTDQRAIANVAQKDEIAEIRKKAIQKLKLQDTLYEIAIADSDEDVRGEALEKLEDQYFLGEIARKYPSVAIRFKALERLTDQKTIAHVAKNDKATEICKKAIQKLKLQDVLYEIAMSDHREDVRQEALEKLEDQNFLGEIARKHSSVEIRCKILDRLTDQKAIAHVAINDKADEICKKAIQKLKLQDVLYEIAMTDHREDVRQEALEKLEDQNFLGEIARKHSSVEIRCKVLDRLTDQKAIAHVAKNDKTDEIRKKAIQKLKFQDVLYEIAMTDHCEDVRQEALEKLGDQNLLGEIACKYPTPEIRFKALDKLTDQKEITNVARKDKVVEIRKKAIQKLKLQDVLYEIAISDPDEVVCMSAFNKIEGLEQFFNIGFLSPFYDIKKRAIEKILDWFRSEFKQESDIFKFFEKELLSNRILETVNLQILQLLYTTLKQCYAYQKLVRDFFENYSFKLGPRVSQLLSTYFLSVIVENNYITRKNDIQRLLYMLQPEVPEYSKDALEFDMELEKRPILYDQYLIECEEYRIVNEQFYAVYEQHRAEYEKYQDEINQINSLKRGLLSNKTSSNVSQYLGKKRMSLPSDWKNHAGEIHSLLHSIEIRKKRLEAMVPKIKSMNDRRISKKKNIEAKIVNLKQIDDRIVNIKNDIELWLKDNQTNLCIVNNEDDDLKTNIIKMNYTWKRRNSVLFEVCIKLLHDNEMLYEASCFCENVADRFKNVLFSQKVKSMMIRSHADFFKLVFRKSIQKIGDDDHVYQVDGPIYLDLQNSTNECDVRFLIVGPTVEQIILRPADYASFEIKPGWYILACVPSDSKITPHILEGRCLPGRRYPVSVMLSQNTYNNYVPSGLGEGYSLDDGIFGAIDINPTRPLQLLFEGKKYHLRNFLGAGSGGFVYQATDEETGIVSAFKFMTDDRLNERITQIDLARKEWQVYEKLVHKENIVTIFSFSEELGFFQDMRELKKKKSIVAYKMEYAHFGNLRNYMEKVIDGNLSVKSVLNILKEISLGLESIHKSELIHRDVRPENILVFQAPPQYRICDFTLTRNKLDLIKERLERYFGNKNFHNSFDAFEERRTLNTLQSYQKIIGASTYYAAPEELEGRGNLDERSDIYSVGGILYWLLVGFDPFELHLRENNRELYERHKMARYCNIHYLDSKHRKALYEELLRLEVELCNANLRLKQSYLMNIDYEEIECTNIEKSSFGIIKNFISRALHPDPDKRFQSATELRCSIETMEHNF